MDNLFLYSVVYLICAYLLGCVNAAYIYSKAVNNTDIRDYSSGNAGATNILRVYGPKAAVPVFLFDAFKGFLACKLSMVFFPGLGWMTLLAGIAVIAGHNWPIFLNYRGGKGVATSVGIGAAIFPSLMLISLALALTIMAVTKYVSLGSMSGIGFFFFVSLFVSSDPYCKLMGALLFALTLYQHRMNIKRLLAGEENKIGKKKN